MADPTAKWGVKQSFRDYVAHLSDGSTQLSGASVSPDGTFIFPLRVDASWWDPVAATGVFRANGSVTFSGHGGMMRATLGDIEVHIESGSAEVFVDGSSSSPNRIARGTVDPGASGPVVIVPTVTTMGSELLGGTYPAGTELDTITIEVGDLPSTSP